MDVEPFVDVVRKHVMHSAVDGVLETLEHPPGRRPAPELVELSRWYKALPAADREMLARALDEVSHAAVFGLFVMLDGERRVDDEQPPGTLELWHSGQGGRTLLSGELHDLLNSQPWRRRGPRP